MSAAATLLALLALLASTGCGHARSQADAQSAVGYSISEVEEAFAAEGLPLTIEGSNSGMSVLYPSEQTLADNLTVQVGPKSEVSGAIWVVYPPKQRPVRVRNVFVSYSPSAAPAAKVRAAIARLRHLRD